MVKTIGKKEVSESIVLTPISAPSGETGKLYVDSGSNILKIHDGSGFRQVINLDSSGKLPVVDGSNLTNLPIISGSYIKTFFDTKIDFYLAKYSATSWQTGTGKTTNAGTTWSASTPTYPRLATFPGTNVGLAFGDSQGIIRYTTDAGTTWTNATTSPTDLVNVYSASFGSSTLAVCCGDIGAGSHYIYRTTDGGINWVTATTHPAGPTQSVTMFDATTGYAITSSGAIWKTVNGGVNWTNTTHTAVNPAYALAISATVVYIIFQAGQPYLYKYDNTTGITTKLNNFRGAVVNGNASNLIYFGGNIYYIYQQTAATAGGTEGVFTLVKYDGTNCYVRNIHNGNQNSSMGTSNQTYQNLIEADGKLYFAIDDYIIEINI
jgi:hypothetical protein